MLEHRQAAEHLRRLGRLLAGVERLEIRVELSAPGRLERKVVDQQPAAPVQIDHVVELDAPRIGGEHVLHAHAIIVDQHPGTVRRHRPERDRAVRLEDRGGVEFGIALDEPERQRHRRIVIEHEVVRIFVPQHRIGVDIVLAAARPRRDPRSGHVSARRHPARDERDRAFDRRAVEAAHALRRQPLDLGRVADDEHGDAGDRRDRRIVDVPEHAHRLVEAFELLGIRLEMRGIVIREHREMLRVGFIPVRARGDRRQRHAQRHHISDHRHPPVTILKWRRDGRKSFGAFRSRLFFPVRRRHSKSAI
jgi:hypothetical protein